MKSKTKILIAPCYIYDQETWMRYLLVSLMTSRCGKLHFLLLDMDNVLSFVLEPAYKDYILAPDLKVDLEIVNNAFSSWIVGERMMIIFTCLAYCLITNIY
jgi:hypothetical protein